MEQMEPHRVRCGWLILFSSLVLASGTTACQASWDAPPAVKAAPNPVPASSANLTAAEATYMDRCERCHGDHGGGDGPDASLYKPLPSSLSEDKTRQLTDGELFWKISKGRRPMPGYENELTEEQRWQLVNLLRTFAAKTAPEAAAPAAKPSP